MALKKLLPSDREQPPVSDVSERACPTFQLRTETTQSLNCELIITQDVITGYYS
jgi:hypothetical protein